MRLAIIPALVLLASTVAAATGDPAPATSTCCAAAAPTAAVERPWYIGPKGGDLRQGKSGAVYRTTVDATPVTAVSVATAVAEHPWYIGPKGGDVRKGTNAAHDNDAAQVVSVVDAPHCSRYVAPAVGPKGGILVGKGQSTTTVLAAADAACQALCSR